MISCFGVQTISLTWRLLHQCPSKYPQNFPYYISIKNLRALFVGTDLVLVVIRVLSCELKMGSSPLAFKWDPSFILFVVIEKQFPCHFSFWCCRYESLYLNLAEFIWKLRDVGPNWIISLLKVFNNCVAYL